MVILKRKRRTVLISPLVINTELLQVTCEEIAVLSPCLTCHRPVTPSHAVIITSFSYEGESGGWGSRRSHPWSARTVRAPGPLRVRSTDERTSTHEWTRTKEEVAWLLSTGGKRSLLPKHCLKDKWPSEPSQIIKGTFRNKQNYSFISLASSQGSVNYNNREVSPTPCDGPSRW